MSSKIGVRFDKSVPYGNDLGGICEDGHGFFCHASQFLKVDDFGEDDFDNIAINEIFEATLPSVQAVETKADVFVPSDIFIQRPSQEEQEETNNPQLEEIAKPPQEEIAKFQPEEISTPLLVETAKPQQDEISPP
ncbi:hypothetical protein RIF29_28603 [Crotalaria pallida]|uniref:Uncharacterized protein n=1 Tax=Crotalaria pallida TaxID=3830 RepID=A0AAN9EDY7_CROPI